MNLFLDLSDRRKNTIKYAQLLAVDVIKAINDFFGPRCDINIIIVIIYLRTPAVQAVQIK